MAIKGFGARRLPRVGKIHLGVKATSDKGTEYPKATDYFVVHSEDNSTPEDAAEAFREVYGTEPRELDVIFPVDDITKFADPFLKMYTRSWKATCIGDGERARAKFDMEQDGPRPEGIDQGTWANAKTKSWVWREVPCDMELCPMRQGDSPACRPVLSLQFMLPSVRGIGVWQCDTGSFYGIRNVQENIEMIRAITGGRVRGIPLKLRLVPKEVTPPTGRVKTKTVHVLDLAMPGVSLQQLLAAVEKLPQDALLPPPADEEVPADLFPEAANGEEEAKVVEAEVIEPAVDATAPYVCPSCQWRGSASELTGTSRDLCPQCQQALPVPVGPKLEHVGDLLTACLAEFGMTRDDVLRALNVKEPSAITDLQHAYEWLRSQREVGAVQNVPNDIIFRGAQGA